MNYKRLTSYGLGFVLFLTSVAASAQQSGNAAGFLDEIVITAQKREENIQDAPLAVSALSEDALRSNGFNFPSELATVVPNFSVADYQGEARIAIRGVGQLVQTANPGVAIHVDGVYQPRASMASLLQLDMSGVEVLRGPQGTVYGRNANGGAINYTTKAPGEEFGGYVQASFAEYSDYRVQAAVNVPVSDAIRARLTVDHSERGEGFVENRGSGRDGQEGLTHLARLRVDADMSDTLAGTFTATWARSDGSFPMLGSRDPISDAAVALNPVLGTAPVTNLLEPLQVSQNTDTIQDREFTSMAAIFDWNISDALSFKSITAQQTFDDFQVLDVDISNGELVSSTYNSDSETFTQEFNFAFENEIMSGVFGLFYLDDQVIGGNNLPFPNGGFLSGFPLPPGSGSAAFWDLDTKSTAVFADTTFYLTDRLGLIAGVRYSEEEIELAQLGGFSVPTPGGRVFLGPPTPCHFDPPAQTSQKVDTVTPRLGVTYSVSDDSNLYATYSEGFKAGGISVRSGCQLEFDEENVDSFEIGLKNTLLEGRLRLNATAFMYDYTGYQIEQLVGLTFLLDNAEEAEIAGLELEAIASVTDNLTLLANASFQKSEFVTHSAIDSLNQNLIPNPNPGPPFVAVPEDVSGNPLPNAPDTTVNVTMIYDWNNGWDVRLGAAYKSDTNFREFDRAEDAQPAYTLWNSSLRWVSSDETKMLRLFGRNLTDEDFINFAAANSLTGNRLVNWGAPRQFGVEFRYSF